MTRIWLKIRSSMDGTCEKRGNNISNEHSITALGYSTWWHAEARIRVDSLLL